MGETRIKHIIIGIVAAVLVVCAIFYCFDQGFLRFNYPSAEEFPVQGLDVSHHQGEVDWPAVTRQGYRFVYIKATEGGDFVDPTFMDNWRNTAKAGLARGAYHFYTFCRPAIEQLHHIVTTIPVERGALTPALDLELGGNCRQTPRKEVLKVELATIIRGMRDHYGKAPLLYMTLEFWEKFADVVPAGKIWIRDVFRRPPMLAGREWVLWQFGNRGRVEGVPARVDLDVLKGGSEILETLRL